MNAHPPSSDAPIESFEITRGAPSGDLLTEYRRDRKLTVGLLACGYPGLRERTEADMQRIADRLGQRYDLVYPRYVDTLDRADAAGLEFRDRQIDALIITESTYCPDYFVHQALTHLPEQLPLCIYASQPHAELNLKADYAEALRGSGPMGLSQLTGGLPQDGEVREIRGGGRPGG